MVKKKQKGRKTTPRKFSTRLKGFLLFVFSLLYVCALLTYSRAIPEANGLGFVGHLIGWITFSLFGLSGFFLPPLCGWFSMYLLLKREISAPFQKGFSCLVGLSSLSLLLTLLAQTLPLCGAPFCRQIAYYYAPGSTMALYYLGGFPAQLLYNHPLFGLHTLLGKVGVFSIFSLLFVVSVSLFFEFSLLDIGRFCFSQLKRFFYWIQEQFAQVSIPRPVAIGSRVRPFQSLEIKDETPRLIREDPLKKLPEVKLMDIPKEPKSSTPSKPVKLGDYLLPGSDLLTEVKRADYKSLKNDLEKQAQILEETLASFGIEAKVGEIHCGPTITSFEVHPAFGVKVQKIKALENDIALNMQARSIRIIAPIPGKAAVGVEVPNPHPQEVGFRELLENYRRQSKKANIPLLLGKIVNGEDVWADLSKMPHLIIAGATGSGKSVCINTIVMSIVMNSRPDEIRLVMVDPKKVELTAYTHMPHMLAPVITEPKGAVSALNWLVKEMEKRYEIFRQLGIRNIQGFNTRERNVELEEAMDLNVPEKMPYIVVIIDELADLMIVSSTADIETPIARIAQMARAVGIHLILATQRPSREVITGLIKANFPCRIAFKVSSRINSQIIIDENGADSLLGNGDMLFLPPGTSTLTRAQGAFIRDEDLNRVIHHVCSQAPTNYMIPNFDTYRDELGDFDDDEMMEKDPLFDEAKRLIFETGTASTTFMQRKLKIGYARAASLMDQMEQHGIVGPSQGAKPREIYYPQVEAEE
jgi:DNA segregation ATPase FtsK/SpoIIIE, S-DNA-T family